MPISKFFAVDVIWENILIMAKRFIDTEIFSDPWFMDLSVNAKLLYIYMITNCNHAGIIDINWKLAEFQTGIKQLSKSYERLTKEYDNRIIRLRDSYYFIPKYISFQYPGFPKSKVRQQEGAIKILIEFNLFDEKNQTLNKEFINSYEYEDDNVSDSVSGNDKGEFEGEIIYPFEDEKFIEAWDLWKKFKKQQFRFTYKPMGEQGALKDIADLSGGNLDKAIAIIHQSIKKGWQGLFDIKGGFVDITNDDINDILSRMEHGK